ncbi:olfactory receptor 6N1-like [Salvelinus fontinalis]|uniref:olfactory receptor 6N1-like n=1 Tax=Salvelinus fontinalis TaxID=8038 RepID=UPI002485F8A6|nr:olfactory receptor 6N1-like [Salvelinus fontinalis]
MENSTQVKLFYLFGLQETFNNKSVYFILSLITYLLIITVNLTLIITIIQGKGLHEPMYVFLCSLCVNGLYGTAGFYPKLLLDLQSDVQVISYGECLTQAYVIYTSVMCEMSTLTVMSYDRYVAICRPLLYHTIVTSLTVRKLLLFSWFYPLFIGLIVVSLTVRLPLCGSRIDKIFCDIPSILKHACLPTTINQMLNKFILVVHVLQLLFIVFSYVTLFDNLQGWNNVNSTLNMRNAMAVQFLIIPPVFNPLIYGLNLQQIRRAVFKKCNAHKTIDSIEERRQRVVSHPEMPDGVPFKIKYPDARERIRRFQLSESIQMLFDFVGEDDAWSEVFTLQAAAGFATLKSTINGSLEDHGIRESTTLYVLWLSVEVVQASVPWAHGRKPLQKRQVRGVKQVVEDTLAN